ncbi:MAG: menaquinone-dependent protoporphyrinogen IX dehydrogenase, partial [Wenzhouxiangellaceae bacterium]|nr:menaquinone-dependent protoporphyrinogen IX dehydrogenase [Wenzhouxiangellaceae bacterium]
MHKTLLLYHSGYGHTRKIVERIRARLVEKGVDAHAAPLDDENLEPAEYDRIVLGASIRNGKHKQPVHAFIERHRQLLEQRPSGFFSVNLVARKPGKNTPETNPYVKAFIEKCPWKPDLVGVFAGNLDYQRYSFMDRNIIRFIMWLTRGPTDPQTNREFTDWDEVD